LSRKSRISPRGPLVTWNSGKIQCSCVGSFRLRYCNLMRTWFPLFVIESNSWWSWLNQKIEWLCCWSLATSRWSYCFAAKVNSDCPQYLGIHLFYCFCNQSKHFRT
jgi:hypothetical protein